MAGRRFITTKVSTLLFAFAFGVQLASTTRATAQVAPGNKEHHQKYKVVDLGTLGGSFSDAFGVNNRGEVVGFSTVSGDVSLHAFLWQNGLLTDLGILGPPDALPSSIAVAINDAGEVVGAS